jgi:hypothetical protein
MSPSMKRAVQILGTAATMFVAGGTAIVSTPKTVEACSYCTQVSPCWGDCSAGTRYECSVYQNSCGWTCYHYDYCY